MGRGCSITHVCFLKAAKKSGKYNTTAIPKTAAACALGDDGSQKYANAINAYVLEVFGDVGPSKLLSSSKLDRQRIKLGEYLAKQQEEKVKGLFCLGFDGRKDKTKTLSEKEVVVIKKSGQQQVDYVMVQGTEKQ